MRDSILNKIEEFSKIQGFSEVKVTDFSKLNFYAENLRRFIKNKYHGEMYWMEQKSSIRENPKNMWYEAKSALVFGLNYGPNSNPLLEIKKTSTGYISVYARRKDYHKVFKKKLKKIAFYISSISKIKVKIFVDTAPLMEKPLAELSSLGWIGKHTNLVSKKYGSWLFLGIILTDHDFKNNQLKGQNNCGTCNACNKVCPTNAFVKPYKLDARKCISYLTIEHKSHIEQKFRDAIGNRIFGCDDCLAICPWNKFAKQNSEIKMNIDNRMTLPSLKKLINLKESEFKENFSGTPLTRLGYERFLRNTLIAIGNSYDNSLIKDTIAKLDHSSILVRAMAIWALSKLSRKYFIIEKKKRFHMEQDKSVKKEWKLGNQL
ncbi:MAG: tRNA epoxyqueuosine(34) reductase QueG [Pseudomonadota bacterium]|nr:tRNA epoxyqueuosine(34) reductase QueG [Pseudomonadota bacterium]